MDYDIAVTYCRRILSEIGIEAYQKWWSANQPVTVGKARQKWHDILSEKEAAQISQWLSELPFSPEDYASEKQTMEDARL